MACQRHPATPTKRFLRLPDVPDIFPPLAGYDPRWRRSSASSISYDPQNDVRSPLFPGTYSSLASAFTAQSQDDLLTATDVVLEASASTSKDPCFASHHVQPEYAGPLRRRLPANPCTASPPPLYSEGLKWGSDLSLRGEAQGLPHPGDVPPTFEQPHCGTALGLYIPQTDEPSGSRPRGRSVDSTMDCKPEPEQMRARPGKAGAASCRSSSPGRQVPSCAASRNSLTRSCSPPRRQSLPPPDRLLWPRGEWLHPHDDRRDDSAGSRKIQAGDGKRAEDGDGRDAAEFKRMKLDEGVPFVQTLETSQL